MFPAPVSPASRAPAAAMRAGGGRAHPHLASLLAGLAALAFATAEPALAYNVASASRDVTVDCGTSGTDVPTDWYFPQPNPGFGLVWLQHGFSRANNHMADLATEIAAQGYVVFATSLAPGASGCAINNPGFLSDFARLFPDLGNPNVGLLESALAAAQSAGVALGSLPSSFAFSGHSAGGASAVAVARNLVVDHPATAASLRGLALLDPVENGTLIGAGLPALVDYPVYTVSSPPYSCNSNARGTSLLTATGWPFVGVRLTSGSHCDAEGDSTDFLCTAFCGTSQPANVAALQTLVLGWIDDFFAPSFTPDWYPSGSYFDSQVGAGRILALPSPSACGNGAPNAGEGCDDGNRTNGDCCNAVCQPEPAGGACTDDGNVCTTDVCNGSGACAHPAGNPGAVCRASSGECDVAEACTGSSTACPANGFTAPGTSCSNDGDPCTTDTCNGSGSCTHPAGNAGAICRASGDDCDVAETCAGLTPGCPANAFAAPGTACTDDGSACTTDTCNGAGTCLHVGGNAGAICRTAADACDIAETCTGASATCPADQQHPDSDADGACDPIDPCTNVDGERDFRTRPRSTLVLSRILTDPTPGNDKLLVRADFRLPSGASLLTLDPLGAGARVRLASAGGAVRLDAVLPGGAYLGNGTRGWLRRATGWRYLDRTASPIGGVTSFDMIDRSSVAAGQIKVKVSGRDGTYPVQSGDTPLEAMVVFGGAAESAAGHCGESAFVGGSCTLNATGTTLRCSR